MAFRHQAFTTRARACRTGPAAVRIRGSRNLPALCFLRHLMNNGFHRGRHAPKLRAALFFGYFVAQIALLLHAQISPDFVFGFQMFNASSELKIALFRKLRAPHRRGLGLVPVRNGAWRAKSADGTVHTHRWNDRVRDGVLGTLDRYVHASYGLEAQLFRLQFALDDVAHHVADDAETEALVAVVDTRKNGRQLRPVRLMGARE